MEGHFEPSILNYGIDKIKNARKGGEGEEMSDIRLKKIALDLIIFLDKIKPIDKCMKLNY